VLGCVEVHSLQVFHCLLYDYKVRFVTAIDFNVLTLVLCPSCDKSSNSAVSPSISRGSDYFPQLQAVCVRIRSLYSYGLGGPGFDSWQWKIFRFSTASTPNLVPTQPPVHGYRRRFPVKLTTRRGQEKWWYTSASVVRLQGTVLN
jgi:hypothetical protein